MRDTSQTFVDGWREVGDIVRFRGVRPMCLIVHPDFVRHVLEDNAANYRRAKTANDALTMLIGESTFTSQGELWRRLARLVHPLYRTDQATMFADGVAEAAFETADRWRTVVSTGVVVDLYDELREAAIGAAARVVFGRDHRRELAQFRSAMIVANEYVIAKSMAVGGPPDIRLRPAFRRYLKAVAVLDSLARTAIAERRERPAHDLVSRLVGARHDGDALRDGEIRNEIMTFLNTLYVSLPTALTWAMLLLSEHEAEQSRLLAELESILADGPATAETMDEASYLMHTVAETLRLHPPLWVFPRAPISEDEIGGYRIPPGLSVILNPYLTHRHPDFWGDAETFDPDRFGAERVTERHPYAYFPFSGGPRGCPADRPALTMIAVGLATLVPRFRVERVDRSAFTQRREFVRRPANGVPVRLVRSA